jgi:hypothetical protein
VVQGRHHLLPPASGGCDEWTHTKWRRLLHTGRYLCAVDRQIKPRPGPPSELHDQRLADVGIGSTSHAARSPRRSMHSHRAAATVGEGDARLLDPVIRTHGCLSASPPSLARDDRLHTAAHRWWKKKRNDEAKMGTRVTMSWAGARARAR